MTAEGTRAETLDLIGGALALDFANTAGGRGTHFALDYLETPADLIAWAGHAELLDASAAGAWTQALSGDSAAGKAALAEARRLREAIYQACTGIVAGEHLASTALSTVADFTANAIAAGSLMPAPGGNFAFVFDPSTLEGAILGPVAVSAMDLLRTGRLDRLKQCPGEDCGWLFLDASKNGSRRWCDMATCGNRHKGHVHRAKIHR